MQAILTTEPLAHSRTCLSHTVTTLLSVAASHTGKPVPSSSSITPVPAAVHALNILRALYRESKLGEVMVSFIAEGVIVAVRGFSSSSWTVSTNCIPLNFSDYFFQIRNSSTLLLSALVTRIFGVKKVHEEHSMENKMSAHEFFTRFPSLHQFLLSELITASEDGSKSERYIATKCTNYNYILLMQAVSCAVDSLTFEALSSAKELFSASSPSISTSSHQVRTH